jgi:hypothetical protein
MSTDRGVIANENLLGAIESVDTLVALLRETQARGDAPSIEDLALSCLQDDEDDPRRLIARLSLMLAAALVRAAS